MQSSGTKNASKGNPETTKVSDHNFNSSIVSL